MHVSSVVLYPPCNFSLFGVYFSTLSQVQVEEKTHVPDVAKFEEQVVRNVHVTFCQSYYMFYSCFFCHL